MTHLNIFKINIYIFVFLFAPRLFGIENQFLHMLMYIHPIIVGLTIFPFIYNQSVNF